MGLIAPVARTGDGGFSFRIRGWRARKGARACGDGQNMRHGSYSVQRRAAAVAAILVDVGAVQSATRAYPPVVLILRAAGGGVDSGQPAAMGEPPSAEVARQDASGVAAHRLSGGLRPRGRLRTAPPILRRRQGRLRRTAAREQRLRGGEDRSRGAARTRLRRAGIRALGRGAHRELRPPRPQLGRRLPEGTPGVRGRRRRLRRLPARCRRQDGWRRTGA